MSFNVDVVPFIKVFVRKEYLMNFESGHGEYEEGYIFGAVGIVNRPILFHVHLRSGAKVMRLPISAFCHIEGAPEAKLGQLQLWDCLGSDMACHRYKYFNHYVAKVRLKDGTWEKGTYVTTFDFKPEGGFEETPDQHKDFNLIALDNGNFAIQPNNRILWVDEHFTSTEEVPKYKTIETLFSLDDTEEASVADSDNYFYVPKGEKL